MKPFTGLSEKPTPSTEVNTERSRAQEGEALFHRVAKVIEENIPKEFNGDAWGAVAKELSGLGRDAEAIALVTEKISNPMQRPRAYLDIARAQASNGNDPEPLLKRVRLEAHKESPWVRNFTVMRLVRAYTDVGNFDMAKKAVDDFIEEPGDRKRVATYRDTSFGIIASEYVRRGRLLEALETMNQISSDAPYTRYDLAASIASAFEKIGYTSLATDLLRQNPNPGRDDRDTPDSEVWPEDYDRETGWVTKIDVFLKAVDQGDDIERPLQELKIAVEHAKQKQLARERLAIALSYAGKFDEAIATAKMVSAEPNNFGHGEFAQRCAFEAIAADMAKRAASLMGSKQGKRTKRNA